MLEIGVNLLFAIIFVASLESMVRVTKALWDA